MCLALAACGTPTAQNQPQAQVVQAAGGSAQAQINAVRAAAGQRGVTRNGTLDAIARAHGRDMTQRNFFSHTGSNGSSVGQRVRAAGYGWCAVAENIAKGRMGQSGALQGWVDSPGHYRNLVNGKVREFGLAQVGDVWVMVLAATRC